jgi:hypothetical protein
LGQRSNITVDLGAGCCSIAADTVATDTFDATATRARDAAFPAADSIVGDSVVADPFVTDSVAKRISIADAGCHSSGIRFESWISVEQ